MRPPLILFVPGTPRPAGSKRGFAIRKGGVLTGKIAMVDSSGEHGKEWRQDVKRAAREAKQAAGWDRTTLLTGPLSLTIEFRMPRPKGHYGSKKGVEHLKPTSPMFHRHKPDTTKLLRAIEDALTGVLWVDDAQIVDQHASKRYVPAGRSGAQIVLECLTDRDCPDTTDQQHNTSHTHERPHVTTPPQTLPAPRPGSVDTVSTEPPGEIVLEYAHTRRERPPARRA